MAVGSLTECIGGPGRTSWDHYEKDGLPIGQSHYVLEDGERRTIVLQDLIHAHGRHGGASIPIANYLKALDKPRKMSGRLTGTACRCFCRHRKILQIQPIIPDCFYCGMPGSGRGDFASAKPYDQGMEYLSEFAEFYESAGADESADPDAPGLGNTLKKEARKGKTASMKTEGSSMRLPPLNTAMIS